MIDRGHALSVTKQAKAAGLARSTVYYLPRPASPADLELMRQIDEPHLEFPFAGARMLRGLLAARGSRTGRRRISVLTCRRPILLPLAAKRRRNIRAPAKGNSRCSLSIWRMRSRSAAGAGRGR